MTDTELLTKAYQHTAATEQSVLSDPYAGQEEKHRNLIDTSWEQIEVPALDALLEPTKRYFSTAIDAGCGFGRTLQYLKSRGVPVNGIVGIEPNYDFLTTAHENFPDMTLIHGDITDSSLPLTATDLLLCSMVLPHLDQQQSAQALRNFNSWTNEGGTLLLSVPHPDAISKQQGISPSYSGWITQQTPWNQSYPFYQRTLSEYIHLTTSAGFHISAIKEPGNNTGDQQSSQKCSEPPRYLFLRAIKPYSSFAHSGRLQQSIRRNN